MSPTRKHGGAHLEKLIFQLMIKKGGASYTRKQFNRKGDIKIMEQVKRMIFNYTNDNGLANDIEFVKLAFAIFKETTHTKRINPFVWLYLNNNYNAFSLILEDILQELYMLYLEDSEKAFGNIYTYAFNTYYNPQANNEPLDQHENELTTDKIHQRSCRWRITHNLNTKIQKEYYKSIVTRTARNLHSRKQVFASSRQKEQTLNKLKQLGII